MRRRVPHLVFFALLAVGCVSEPPARETPPTAVPPPVETPTPAGSGEAGTAEGEDAAEARPPSVAEPSPEPAADCSAAAVSGNLPQQPELPPPVTATRRAIFAAATGCDLAALDQLAPAELRYTFGEPGDAIAAWRDAEDRGEPVLRWMAEVLRATPERQHGTWVWPGFFLRTVDEWTAADRRQAERLLGDELAPLTGSGAYLGYRVGIAEDGTWQYFVAGD